MSARRALLAIATFAALTLALLNRFTSSCFQQIVNSGEQLFGTDFRWHSRENIWDRRSIHWLC